MIRAIIIDDEPNNIETLSDLLRQFCPDVEVVGTAMSSAAGKTILQEQEPDLVFLDIEMPFGNAFDLLEKMMPVRFEVVFVTAFDHYAITAFKYSALDYLLKPVSIDELKRVVSKAKQRVGEKTVNLRVESFMNNFRNDSPGLKKIGLPITDGLVFEETDNIVHLEAEGNYTRVFTKDQKKKTVTKSLKEFEDILPTNIFCRIHHSHIINLNYIKKYYKGRGGYVELIDGTTVEVSSRKKDEFLDKFKL